MIALAIATLIFPAISSKTGPPAPTQTAAPSAATAMAHIPPSFEPNVGQFDDRVRFVSRHGGPMVFFTQSEAVFVYAKSRPVDPTSGPDRDPSRQTPPEQAVLRMGFVGANPDALIEASDPQEGKTNYFIGNDPSKWHTDISNYSRITYHNIYRGIDLTFYGNQYSAIEYDFVVAPGADPGQVKLSMTSDAAARITDDGNLAVTTTLGDVGFKAPTSYQGEEKSSVISAYQANSDGTFGFDLGAYDSSKTLTIDPVALVYSTYLGGSGDDAGAAVAVDEAGNLYVGGYTASWDFPTASAFQPSKGVGVFPTSDAFVTKINAAGSALVYSSYLGGGGDDMGYGIAIDGSGSAYLTGHTESADFPTVAPIQALFGGWSDAYVTKVSATGSSLTFSTYLGGSVNDEGRAIAVDGSDSAYVTGYTGSSDFPTASAFQGSFAGSSDAFVTKINPAGSALTYSTYLGGSWEDGGRGIAVDGTSNAYVTGYAQSTNFPTALAFQGSNAGGLHDAFVTKINPAGSALIYSTYLGGSGDDSGYGIALDGPGSAFVSGITASTNFPTVSAFQGSNAGGAYDAFVTKINPAGSALTYSSYLGGTGDDFAFGIAVDSAGSALGGGSTSSSDFPTTSPLQGSNAGGARDAFVTKINPAGSALTYSSYLGGTGDDFARGVAVDSSGAAYLTGLATSTDFPAAGSAFQGANAGYSDDFVTKIQEVTAIAGTFTNGTWGAISVYDASGNMVSYVCCMTGDTWSASVPESSCPAGGYKVLWISPDTTRQSRWYNLKDNWSSGDCVSAPSAGNNMTIPAAGLISGYIKDSSTAADINGAVVYAFKASDGTYVGYGSTGANGRYELNLSTSETYKLMVNPGASYVQQWYSGAQNYSEATPQTPPTTANFSVTPAGVIDGYVKDATTAADLNGYPVYAYTTAGTFYAYGVTDRGYGAGHYRITVNPGSSYKLVSTGGPYSTQWYSGATSFSASTATAAPFTANFSKS